MPWWTIVIALAVLGGIIELFDWLEKKLAASEAKKRAKELKKNNQLPPGWDE